jgi:hypothetical protein
VPERDRVGWSISPTSASHRRCRAYVVGRTGGFSSGGRSQRRGAVGDGWVVVGGLFFFSLFFLSLSSLAPPILDLPPRKILQYDLRHTTYAPPTLEVRSRGRQSRSRVPAPAEITTTVAGAHHDAALPRPQRLLPRAATSLAAPASPRRSANASARSVFGGTAWCWVGLRGGDLATQFCGTYLNLSRSSKCE